MSEENNQSNASAIFRDALSKFVSRAEQKARNAGQNLKDERYVRQCMYECEHLKIHFSGESGTYRKLIMALLAKNIDPHTVIFGNTTNKNRTILLSLDHQITETGKIKSVPGTFAFDIDKGILVDLYQKSIDNEEFEIRAFAEERAKDAEARKRRSRGIVVSWGK